MTKLEFSREWWMARAAIEGDSEVGAGRRSRPHPQEDPDMTDTSLVEMLKTAATTHTYMDDELRALCGQAADALAAREAGVPDGWRLVPVEPTAEMIHAVLPMYDRMIADSEWPFTINLWRKLLAASPSPAAPPQEREERERLARAVERAGAYPVLLDEKDATAIATLLRTQAGER